MSIKHRLTDACTRAETFQENFRVQHPYIYMACKFFIKKGIHYAINFGVDALGALVGDPLLFEEIEAIYFAVKITAHISYKLYQYLKSTRHVHQQSIERMDHHENRDDLKEGSGEDYDEYENNRDTDYRSRNYREYDREVSGSACQCVIS
jgi:hypothetical protein